MGNIFIDILRDNKDVRNIVVILIQDFTLQASSS